MLERLGVDLAQFHFIRPYALAALIPLAVLVIALVRRRLGGGRWESVCDPALLPHVLVESGARRKRWLLWLLTAAAALGIVALAGPTWERLPVPVFRNESALVIVLDLSRSMDARDVDPSRLARARYKIEDILRQRTDGQTGLVVFAEQAFSVTPLTTDVRTIISQLSALNTDLMPVQGSRADRGLLKAAKLLEQAGATHGDVLLITDGADAIERHRIERVLKNYPYRVSILGVGTAQGAPIPLQGGGFIQNEHGAIVLSKLDAGALMALARRGGGIYEHLAPGDEDVDALTAEFKPDRLDTPVKGTKLKADTWREEGPWLLLLVLPLAALAFRRGVLTVLCLGVLLPLARPAHAYSWSDLWLRPDQQASRAFARGDASRAASLFRNPRWKAAADYRAGHFARALKDVKRPATAADWYNRGNALARLGRYQAAVHAYDEALKLDPGYKDARYNRTQVKKALQSRPPPQPQQSGRQSGRENRREGGSQNRQAGKGSKGNSGSRAQTQGDRGGQQGAGEHRSESTERDRRPGASEQGQEARRNSAEGATKGHSPTKQPGKSRARRGTKDRAGQKGNAPKLADSGPESESRQADQQWLRRIPDDPGGLLRRKFLYQYRKDVKSGNDDDQPW